MAGTLHRREFLLSALAVAQLSAQSAAPAGLGIRYRTDPNLLQRMLPTGFEPAAEPHVQVDFAADASWAKVLIAVRHGGRDGWFPVALWTSSDRVRLVAREGIGLGAVPAEITVSDGMARVSAAGETILELKTKQGGGEPLAADPRPLFYLRFSADEDWTQGEPRGAAEILEYVWPAADKTALDSTGSTLKWLRFSPSEPAAELPILEVLNAWSAESSGTLGAQQSEPTEVARARNESISPWMPLRYPRPSFDLAIRRPDGWPDQTTALRWTEAESQLWQTRPEIRFDPVEIVEVTAVISPEIHAALLPPACLPGNSPLIKVLGIRFGALAEQPVNELWLMAYCRIGRVSAWYTLSHIVGPGGDLVYGRETFGYPSKSGEPSVVVTPVNCSLTGYRQGREFFYADGAYGGFTTGTSLGRMNIVSLRVRPGQRLGELILQEWTYQGRRQQVTELSAAMGVSDAASSETDVRLDPWYELQPLQLASIGAFETGLMQRHPAEVVGVVEHPEPFYRERCDGILPWEPDPQKHPQPSLIMGNSTPAKS